MELQTNRLSRWTRDGEIAVVLTEDDIKVFSILNRYKFGRADFIAALLGRPVKKVSQRLNLLCREPNRYIRRPDAQRQYVNAMYRYLIYENDDRGRDVLRSRSIDIIEQRLGGHRHFAHAMMINDTLQSLELGIRGNAQLISWQEIAEGTKFPHGSSTVIPVNIGYKFKSGKTDHLKFDFTNDGCFAVKYPGGGFRTFQLEAEHNNRVWCTNLEQTSFLKKFLAVQDIMERKLYREQWGVSTLYTLVVCNIPQHIETMKNLVAQLDPTRRVSPFILFREIPAMEDLRPARPMPNLWGSWQRAGLPPLDISNPEGR